MKPVYFSGNIFIFTYDNTTEIITSFKIKLKRMGYFSLKVVTFVGFEVLTVAVNKSSVFWDKTPCSPLKVNRHLEGTYRLHLHGR
jgi:hypothetical protein